jgi:hypothetical protein
VLAALDLVPGAVESAAEKTGERVEQVHDRVSDFVLGTAEWVDYFLMDQNFEAEENTTSFRLRLDSFAEEREGVDFNAKVRFNLQLPGAMQRLNLIISGGQDSGDSGDDGFDESGRQERRDDEDRTIDAALKYYLAQAENYNLSLRGGLRWRDNTAVGFIEPRYRGYVDLYPWGLRFIQRFRYFTDVGWDSRTQLDLERPLTGDLFFRTSARGDWEEEDRIFDYSLRFLLTQPLDTERMLTYEWNNFFITEPEHDLDELNLRVRFRQRMWWPWLFFEMAPQVKFPREYDYDAVVGFLFRIDTYFGSERALPRTVAEE